MTGLQEALCLLRAWDRVVRFFAMVADALLVDIRAPHSDEIKILKIV